MDVDKLLKALDNESNSHMMNLTSQKIKATKHDILSNLRVSRHDFMDMMKKLKDYRYVDGMDELSYGTYVRWVPIADVHNIHLTRGAIFCEFNVTDTGTYVVCKNGFSESYFQFKMEENLIFQKITNEERVLLCALDHLAKPKKQH